MSSAAQYTRERLIQAAGQCSDIDEVIAFFGTRPYDKLRRHLYKRFEHFGIDTSHFPAIADVGRRTCRVRVSCAKQSPSPFPSQAFSGYCNARTTHGCARCFRS